MDRVVEIATDGRHLSRHRGFMLVTEQGAEIGRVPLDQILAVIVNAHGVTYTNSLLVELAERGASLVLCGRNHQPRAMLWPLEGHHAQGARMRAQWTARASLSKQAWKSIVIAKIRMQGAALDAIGETGGGLRRLAGAVRSGDVTNVEAMAARRYWPMMMGREFRRDPTGDGLNSLLNYGYTVLRSASARAVVAAGLNPTIGIHHSNRGNAFALADDLMEPFRPIIDFVARDIARESTPELDPETKGRLARLIALDFKYSGETTPASRALMRLATSMAQSFETNRLKLDLPAPLPAETFESLLR